MSLSIQDCAAQFELYAKSHDDAAAQQIAHAETLPEGVSRGVAFMLADPSKASAHSLRFCATFLRENAVLHWTKEAPTKDGFYWVRNVYSRAVDVALVTLDDNRVTLNRYCDLTADDLTAHEWAGPIAAPLEPTEQREGIQPCCPNEDRGFNGGCRSCGDPSL